MTRLRGFRFLALSLVLVLLVCRFPAVAAQSDTDSSIDGNTYTSPSFGYAVTWDGTIWTPSAEYSQFGYDLLNLESAGPTLSIEGMYGYKGSPGTCLTSERATVAAGLGLSDLAPVTGTNGNPLETIADGGAQGIYIIPVSSTDETPASLLFLDCQVGVRYLSVILTTAYLDPANMQDEGAAVLKVVQGITFSPPVDMNAFDAQIQADLADLDAYWSEIYPAYADNYVFPELDTYSQGEVYHCKIDYTTDTDAFYCPENGTLLYDADSIALYELKYGVFAADMLIGHEFGHHIQALLYLSNCIDIECPARETQTIELQANCFAGAWMQDAVARGYFDSSMEPRLLDSVQAAQGDTSADDLAVGGSGDHGTPEERVAWFMTGYEGGPDACLSE